MTEMHEGLGGQSGVLCLLVRALTFPAAHRTISKAVSLQLGASSPARPPGADRCPPHSPEQPGAHFLSPTSSFSNPLSTVARGDRHQSEAAVPGAVPLGRADPAASRLPAFPAGPRTWPQQTPGPASSAPSGVCLSIPGPGVFALSSPSGHRDLSLQ